MMRKLALLLLLVGCGKSETSGLRYATFTPGAAVLRSWSAYTVMEENGCTLPISIIGNGFQLSQAELLRLQGFLVNSVGAWTNAIDGNPFWKCQQAFVSFGPSPREYRVFVYPNVIRGFARVGQAEVHIGRDIVDGSNPFAERIVLHEMGHMFGLSDTYSEAGYQQPIGQPSGIMNNLYGVSGLTEDDVNGANALYDYMNGRAPFCRAGYVPGGAFENRNQIAFCVKG